MEPSNGDDDDMEPNNPASPGSVAETPQTGASGADPPSFVEDPAAAASDLYNNLVNLFDPHAAVITGRDNLGNARDPMARSDLAREIWNSLVGNTDASGAVIHPWSESLANMWDGIPWVAENFLNVALRDADNNGYDDAAPMRRRWPGTAYDYFYDFPLATHEPTLSQRVSLTSANLTNTNAVDEQLRQAAVMTFTPGLAALDTLVRGYTDYLYDAAQRTLVEAGLADSSLHWYYHAREVHIRAILARVQAAYDAVAADPPMPLITLIQDFATRATELRNTYGLSDITRVTTRGVAAGNAWNTALANGDADGNILYPWSQTIADNFEHIEYVYHPGTTDLLDTDYNGYINATGDRAFKQSYLDWMYAYPWAQNGQSLFSGQQEVAQITSFINATYSRVNTLSAYASSLVLVTLGRTAIAELAVEMQDKRDYVNDMIAVSATQAVADRQYSIPRGLAQKDFIDGEVILAHELLAWWGDQVTFVEAYIAEHDEVYTRYLERSIVYADDAEELATLIAYRAHFDADLAAWAEDRVVNQRPAAVFNHLEGYVTPLIPYIDAEIQRMHYKYINIATDWANAKLVDWYGGGMNAQVVGSSGFRLARYLPVGSTAWHPSADNLAGTSNYGDVYDSAVSWSRPFAHANFPALTEVLFATADFSEWLYIEWSVLTTAVTSELSNQPLLVKATSENSSPHNVVVYNRSGVTNRVDPIIGLTTNWNPPIYAENGFVQGDAFALGASKGGYIFVR